VECNPTSFDAERARALLDQGVNRVSIGVQGLNRERLAFLGRLHDVDGGLAAVRAAVAAGVPHVSADLIFGVHGQSAKDAAEEASRIADLGVSHLSAYALTIEPGTQFGERARAGRLPLLTDDTVAESFVAVDEALTARGFTHYEISNYGRGDERALHNLAVWRGHDYLGLGVGAWGTVTVGGARRRSRNTPAPERYLPGRWSEAALDRTSSLIAEVEAIDAQTALCERLMLGLRLAEGVSFDELARDLNVDPWTPARRRTVERLIARGSLLADGPRLRVPPDKWLLADGIIRDVL
jgi:oxygen-independent coproporphyrinogen-3 oxidase